MPQPKTAAQSVANFGSPATTAAYIERSTARAMAWRTFTLSNGGCRWFMRMMAWKPYLLTTSALAPDLASNSGSRSAGTLSR